ncbi:glutaminyl-peptide cyclotransferase [Desulfolutivibrio sulfoxidireducens]|uniref:glutaminyl-peptide cyclotransferase n=1 Tax=Desulfolutivibrio sulfoxidireducens TaxID=2773299 RepID=UPI00159E51D1|nr:glutaminyl-peptide cyclotransferase [Desulfolutivibrio sulfoxidireducens]QLA19265.1 glutaminyl-peptide cyclotransferase [Desulfolutivibrio sulfoxidireducens]
MAKTSFARAVSVVFLVAGLAAVSAATGVPSARAGAPVIGWRVAAVHPHDPGAFTQGLVFRDGALFESTGRYGQSSLRRVDAATGRVLARRNLPASFFGEGLEEVAGRLFQLTWREHAVLVYDAATFDAVGQKYLPTEGWGICHDGASFVVSDGTSVLTRYDTATFARLGRVRVADDGVPVDNINELECAHGHIYANVWMTDRVAVIDPANGRVLAWLDLSGLRVQMGGLPLEAITNGLAHDPRRNRFFVTGKLWPRLFELVVDPVPDGRAVPVPPVSPVSPVSKDAP